MFFDRKTVKDISESLDDGEDLDPYIYCVFSAGCLEENPLQVLSTWHVEQRFEHLYTYKHPRSGQNMVFLDLQSEDSKEFDGDFNTWCSKKVDPQIILQNTIMEASSASVIHQMKKRRLEEKNKNSEKNNSPSASVSSLASSTMSPSNNSSSSVSDIIFSASSNSKTNSNL